MNPEPPPDTADETSVDASGDGWEGETDPGSRDSFVWNAESEHDADSTSERVDEDDHGVGTETEIEFDRHEHVAHDGNEGSTDHATRLATESSGVTTLRPERYLLAGEALVEHVETDRGWVAVTTHRLLVYDPTADGKRFESVDRPNVLGVEATDGGDPKLLSYIARASMYAVVLLSGGLVGRSLGLRGLFSTAVGSETTPAVDGLVSVLSVVGTLVGLVVDVFVWGGVAASVVALGLSVWYLRDRYPTLVLERAGADDIAVRLPPVGDGDRVVDVLERALAVELACGSS